MTLCVFSAVAMATALGSPTPSSAQARAKLGTLACDISGGIGMLVASKKEVACMFTPAQPGPREVYTGSIAKFALDGSTAGGELVWSVFAPGNKHFGALTGNYGGAGAAATVGAGLGANVLIGGTNRTVALQPLSAQGQPGVNVAAGVSELQLRPAR